MANYYGVPYRPQGTSGSDWSAYYKPDNVQKNYPGSSYRPQNPTLMSIPNLPARPSLPAQPPIPAQYMPPPPTTDYMAPPPVTTNASPPPTTSYMPPPPTANFMPQLGESLDTLLRKLTALRQLCQSGDSIAAVTDYQGAAMKDRDTERKAMTGMTPDELLAYTAYRDGKLGPLPAMNWATDRGPPPTSAKPLKTAKRRAEALNRLYRTNAAEPAHSVWFTQRHLAWLPLVKAVARVIGAETHAVGGHENANPEEWAELQTLGKVISVASQIMQKSAQQGPQKKAVNNILQQLIQRRQQIHERLGTGKKRKGGADEQVDGAAQHGGKRGRQD